MAGRKQHFIQRLLLRGFSFDAHQDPCHVWVHKRDGKIFAPALEGYGAERDFYGHPEESDLDSRMTDIESNKFNAFLKDLRRGPDRCIDPELASDFAIHVFLRSKNFRSMQAAGVEPLVTRIRDILKSGAMVEKLLLSGAREAQTDPALQGFIKDRVNKRRPQIQSYLDNLSRMASQLVTNQHRQVLQARLNDLSGTRRAQMLGLQWNVVTTVNDLVLGDSVVFAELTNGTYKPVTEPNDALARIWLPIQCSRVLVGSAPGHDLPPDASRINQGAAACSFDAFCASTGPETHKHLTPLIRTCTFSLDDAAIERVLQNAFARIGFQ